MWLALGASAHAASLSTYGAAGQACGSGTSCNLLNVSGSAVPNQSILVCVNTYGGTSAATGLGVTINGVSLTQWGSTVTQGKSVKGCFHKTIASGDAGLAIDTSWTNANSATITEWIIVPSDNVAPTFGTTASTVCGPSAGACTPATVTPAQSGDLIFNACNFGGGSPDWNSSTSSSFPTLTTGVDVSGTFGWSGTSGSPTMTAATQTVGGAIYDIACLTGDIEASGTGSVIVGAADTYNSGSSTRLSIRTPLNNNLNDTLIAGILENTTGIAITAPPATDVLLHGAGNAQSTGTSSCTAVVDATTKVGDRLVTIIDTNASGTVTAPSPTAGENSWTLVDTITNATHSSPFSIYSKLATSGDIGQSQTWTGTAHYSLCGVSSWYSASGGTVTIETDKLTSGTTSGAYTAPAITTTHNNDVIVPFCTDSSTTMTFASLVFPVWSISFSVANWYFQASAGSSATPACTPNSGGGVDIGQLALTSGGTAGPSWVHQSPTAVTDPTDVAQIDVFTLQPPSNHNYVGTTFTFQFASSEVTSEGIMVDAGNLNTTTPIDVGGSLVNAGEAQTQEAPLNPTPNDELALSFNGYDAGPFGERGGQYPQAITIGTHMSAYYTTPNAAVVAQAVDSVMAPYASITLGLKAASTPARTTANVDINQHVIEIFSTTAPVPPPASVGAWFF